MQLFESEVKQKKAFFKGQTVVFAPFVKRSEFLLSLQCSLAHELFSQKRPNKAEILVEPSTQPCAWAILSKRSL
jgi:hypothetical protein